MNKVEQASNDIKNFQNKIENLQTVNKNERTVSNMEIDYNQNLTDKYYYFDFDGTKFRYRLYEPTNFYISNDNFGAAEVCNTYFYSEGGQKIDNVWNLELNSSTIITFCCWEYDPANDIHKMNTLLKSYNLESPKVETINKGNFIYRVTAESNTTYYEAYFLKTLGKWEDDQETHDNLFQIELRINKRDVSLEKIQHILNEYHSIIDTLETSY